MTRIAIIQGHPDPAPERFDRALAAAYEKAAREAGHEVKTRFYFRGHSMKSLERNILNFCGIAPVRSSFVGTIEAKASRQKWLAKMAALGRKAA